uniref:Uncharacterized protein n=1 Tax=Trypanosoma vivax (strain Y486) TaxID=1055687 RepID=G0UBY2_TRYVY|nr:hypothetical protein, unlikely [Trypanosoma vivax Y486]
MNQPQNLPYGKRIKTGANRMLQKEVVSVHRLFVVVVAVGTEQRVHIPISTVMTSLISRMQEKRKRKVGRGTKQQRKQFFFFLKKKSRELHHNPFITSPFSFRVCFLYFFF